MEPFGIFFWLFLNQLYDNILKRMKKKFVFWRLFMTKGQVESKISEAISKFEIEQMGRGPERIRTIIFQDLILIRLNGFLSQSEKKLAMNRDGVDLVKKVRTALFENARDVLEEAIKSVIDINIISTHSDVSTKRGEKIIVIVADQNIEVLINENQ